MISQKSVYALALVSLMSTSMHISCAGEGLQKGLQIAGVLVGGGYSWAVYQDAYNEFKKSKSIGTSFDEDLLKVGGACVAVPLTVGLLMGSAADGGKAIVNTALGGAVFLVVNRMMETHDMRFWPFAASLFLYNLGKAGLKALEIPLHDFAG